jgi:tripartite-type tricarboxylate transporter receptor subunit TctC
MEKPTMLRTFGTLALFAFAPLIALAQGYPSKPITLVNGFPPGGGPDILARQLATALTKRMNQNVLVDNRPGATGTIGAGYVARAEPDGYTLLFGVAANLVIGPATLDVPYDPVKSFAPIVEIARGPYLMLVSTRLPVTSVAQLIEYAKARPKQLNFGSVGPGSPHHFAGELFNREAGVQLVHIPYKGGGPAYAAFMQGEIQVMFDSMPGPQAHLQSGTVRAIGVTGARRLPMMPDVPTLAEQGVPGIDIHFMFGVMAPAGTPKDVVARLNAEIAQALNDADVRATLARQGVQPSPGTPEAFGALVASEFSRWKGIVQQTGFKSQR